MPSQYRNVFSGLPGLQEPFLEPLGRYVDQRIEVAGAKVISALSCSDEVLDTLLSSLVMKSICNG
jgi:hypothetical protein